MIRSFDSGQRWTLQKSTVLGSPELHEFRPGPQPPQSNSAQSHPAQPLQFCPESLRRALLAEENRQTLKLVARLRWASHAVKN